MGSKNIRTPQQQRSIDKRNRIIEAGYQLFCEKGYYNTNTAEIAKLAGVSTGILYNYFKDKKDIFLYVIESIEYNTAMPIYDMIRHMSPSADLDAVIREVIKAVVQTYAAKKSVQEVMYALSRTDPDIKEIFYQIQAKTASQMVELLKEMGVTTSNAYEKSHIIIYIIQNISLEFVYKHHDYLNHEAMIDVAVKTIKSMLTD